MLWLETQKQNRSIWTCGNSIVCHLFDSSKKNLIKTLKKIGKHAKKKEKTQSNQIWFSLKCVSCTSVSTKNTFDMAFTSTSTLAPFYSNFVLFKPISCSNNPYPLLLLLYAIPIYVVQYVCIHTHTHIPHTFNIFFSSSNFMHVIIHLFIYSQCAQYLLILFESN